MSEEIIALLVMGAGYLIEYWRKNKNERALKAVEAVEKSVDVAIRIAKATGDERVDELMYRVQEYAERAGFRLSPRLRLLARQKIRDELFLDKAQGTTFDELKASQPDNTGLVDAASKR